MWRLRRTVSGFSRRKVSRTYHGTPLTIELADPLGEGWYDHDWDELKEITFLRRHRLRTGATVFDLGAHQAVVALILAKIVGPGGRIVAVEANAHNVAVANRNKELNGADNLTIVHAAVADRSGSLVFNHGLNGQVDDGRGEWGRSDVAAVSIDDLARQYGAPDVLFLDVEGYELKALEGARQTLAAGSDCFVEVHVGCGLEHFGGSVAAVARQFPPDRYDCYMLSQEHGEAVPFQSDADLTKKRFYFIAIQRPWGA